MGKESSLFNQTKGATDVFIPGRYSVAKLPDKETEEVIKRWTYTIITKPANSVMKIIHNGGDNKWRTPFSSI